MFGNTRLDAHQQTVPVDANPKTLGGCTYRASLTDFLFVTRVYIIGAGLAGLSAAVTLSRSGRAVALYEASGQAGGRCRSFFDTSLNRVIDNGNHLLLTGYQYTMSYLRDIDAVDALVGPTPASFPFLDLRTGQRWSLQPSEGRIPWWILDPRRRVPGTRLWDYRSGLGFAVAGSGRTVSDCGGDRGALIEKFWEPLAIATLNSPLQTGAASLLWPVLREILGGGEAACRPRIARTGLSPTFVDPAIALLHRHGAHVRFGTRLRTITYEDAKARVLDFGTETVALEDGDSVVLALPPQAAMNLVPDLTVPEESHAIINAHFRLPEVKSLPAGLPFLGLIGGTATGSTGYLLAAGSPIVMPELRCMILSGLNEYDFRARHLVVTNDSKIE